MTTPDPDVLPRPPLSTPRIRWGLIGLGAIALSALAAGVGQGEIFNPGGWSQIERFFRASLQPDLSAEFLPIVGRATWVTLTYAVCGTVLSIVIGLLGGVLASEVWWLAVMPRQPQRVWFWGTIRSALAIPRAIHELIWGLFLLNILGLDPLVGILAIAIPYGAIVAKVFSEILDETPHQPLEALLNSGVSPLTAFTYTLLPQAFLDLLSYTFYRFECSIRSAAVLGIIGAGGLGYEIFLSLQSLRYAQLWTLFYALIFLSGTVDLASAALRRHLGSPSRLDLNLKKTHRWRRSPSLRDPWILLTLGGLGILIPLCFWSVGADVSKLWSPRTLQLLQDVKATAWPPRFDLAEGRLLLFLSLQTVAMSILAITLAGVGGIFLSFPAASNFFLPGGLFQPGHAAGGDRLAAWLLLGLSRALLLLFRAVPAPIWALVILYGMFPGLWPGAIALGIHNLGILGRLMAEANENLDQRPLVALKAQGTPVNLVFLYGVLPLTLTRSLAYILYRWEVCMRETVIVGLVGAGGLGRVLTEQLSSFDYPRVVVTLSCFILLTFGVDGVSQAARRSLR
jgi:phosphonate transport system permease protein